MEMVSIGIVNSRDRGSEGGREGAGEESAAGGGSMRSGVEACWRRQADGGHGDDGMSSMEPRKSTRKGKGKGKGKTKRKEEKRRTVTHCTD